MSSSLRYVDQTFSNEDYEDTNLEYVPDVLKNAQSTV